MIVLPDNKKEDLIYTKCYCEENIYHLCKKFLLDEKNEDYKEGIYVCFISNEDKVVPLFRQSSSELENGLVLWDYHVILILKEKQKKFRLIPGETFVKVFASDRSHMIDKDGMWNSPPPNYPPISNQEFTMNLDLFISMTENLNSDKFGKVINESEFIKNNSLYLGVYIESFIMDLDVDGVYRAFPFMKSILSIDKPSVMSLSLTLAHPITLQV
nr:67_t:CDS:2 [Entrophospora candida]